ncbi:hypothetical protein CBR_g20270 [Chara braunii]|uniref:Uncharacterized protein n=1 Tax=Chara braunii TaxID=69332 RepID=A0A388L037_CHABU|nr:hypothetical protein CBR_g20270 [Chara braunii]|eukprot:GBG75641.1 hypothetical protein CBR_g20270 [Chara braunii]
MDAQKALSVQEWEQILIDFGAREKSRRRWLTVYPPPMLFENALNVIAREKDLQLKSLALCLLEEYGEILVGPNPSAALNRVVDILLAVVGVSVDGSFVTYVFKGQVLVTFTSLAIQLEIARSNPLKLQSLVEVLLAIISRVNQGQDRHVRGVACECLRELELAYPCLLHNCIGHIHIFCQSEKTHVIQSYILLLTTILQHVSACLCVLPTAPSTAGNSAAASSRASRSSDWPPLSLSSSISLWLQAASSVKAQAASDAGDGLHSQSRPLLSMQTPLLPFTLPSFLLTFCNADKLCAQNRSKGAVYGSERQQVAGPEVLGSVGSVSGKSTDSQSRSSLQRTPGPRKAAVSMTPSQSGRFSDAGEVDVSGRAGIAAENAPASSADTTASAPAVSTSSIPVCELSPSMWKESSRVVSFVLESLHRLTPCSVLELAMLLSSTVVALDIRFSHIKHHLLPILDVHDPALCHALLLLHVRLPDAFDGGDLAQLLKWIFLLSKDAALPLVFRLLSIHWLAGSQLHSSFLPLLLQQQQQQQLQQQQQQEMSSAGTAANTTALSCLKVCVKGLYPSLFDPLSLKAICLEMLAYCIPYLMEVIATAPTQQDGQKHPACKLLAESLSSVAGYQLAAHGSLEEHIMLRTLHRVLSATCPVSENCLQKSGSRPGPLLAPIPSPQAEAKRWDSHCGSPELRLVLFRAVKDILVSTSLKILRAVPGVLDFVRRLSICALHRKAGDMLLWRIQTDLLPDLQANRALPAYFPFMEKLLENKEIPPQPVLRLLFRYLCAREGLGLIPGSTGSKGGQVPPPVVSRGSGGSKAAASQAVKRPRKRLWLHGNQVLGLCRIAMLNHHSSEIFSLSCQILQVLCLRFPDVEVRDSARLYLRLLTEAEGSKLRKILSYAQELKDDYKGVAGTFPTLLRGSSMPSDRDEGAASSEVFLSRIRLPLVADAMGAVQQRPEFLPATGSTLGHDERTEGDMPWQWNNEEGSRHRPVGCLESPQDTSSDGLDGLGDVDEVVACYFRGIWGPGTEKRKIRVPCLVWYQAADEAFGRVGDPRTLLTRIPSGNGFDSADECGELESDEEVAQWPVVYSVVFSFSMSPTLYEPIAPIQVPFLLSQPPRRNKEIPASDDGSGSDLGEGRYRPEGGEVSNCARVGGTNRSSDGPLERESGRAQNSSGRYRRSRLRRARPNVSAAEEDGEEEEVDEKERGGSVEKEHDDDNDNDAADADAYAGGDDDFAGEELGGDEHADLCRVGVELVMVELCPIEPVPSSMDVCVAYTGEAGRTAASRLSSIPVGIEDLFLLPHVPRCLPSSSLPSREQEKTISPLKFRIALFGELWSACRGGREVIRGVESPGEEEERNGGNADAMGNSVIIEGAEAVKLLDMSVDSVLDALDVHLAPFVFSVTGTALGEILRERESPLYRLVDEIDRLGVFGKGDEDDPYLDRSGGYDDVSDASAPAHFSERYEKTAGWHAQGGKKPRSKAAVGTAGNSMQLVVVEDPWEGGGLGRAGEGGNVRYEGEFRRRGRQAPWLKLGSMKVLIFLPPRYHLLLWMEVSTESTLVRMRTDYLPCLAQMDEYLEILVCRIT